MIQALVLAITVAHAFLTPEAIHSKGGGGGGGGGSGAHGGDVVACWRNTKFRDFVREVLRKNAENPKEPQDPFTAEVLSDLQSVELYELQRARRSLGTEKVISPVGTESEIYQERLALIGKYSSFESDLETARTLTIPDSQWYGQAGPVREIDDFELIQVLTPNCLLVQIAYQIERKADVLYEVYVDNRLLERLKPVDRAAFRLHEYLQNLRFFRKKTEAMLVHHLVERVFLESFGRATSSGEFVDLLVRLGFDNRIRREIQFAGVSWPVEKAEKEWTLRDVEVLGWRVPKGTLVQFRDPNTFWVQHGEKNGQWAANLLFGSTRVYAVDVMDLLKVGELSFRGTVYFHENGSVLAGSPFNLRLFDQRVNWVKYSDDGRVLQLRFEGVATISHQGESLRCREASFLHTRGELSSCVMDSSAWFLMRLGSEAKVIALRDEVTFHENGRVSRGTPARSGQELGGVKLRSESIELYPSGDIEVAWGVGVSWVPIVRGPLIPCHGKIRFFEGGRVKACTLAQAFEIGHATWKGEIEFYPNGEVRSGTLGVAATFDGLDFRASELVQFDERGRVLP